MHRWFGFVLLLYIAVTLTNARNPKQVSYTANLNATNSTSNSADFETLKSAQDQYFRDSFFSFLKSPFSFATPKPIKNNVLSKKQGKAAKKRRKVPRLRRNPALLAPNARALQRQRYLRGNKKQNKNVRKRHLRRSDNQIFASLPPITSMDDLPLMSGPNRPGPNMFGPGPSNKLSSNFPTSPFNPGMNFPGAMHNSYANPMQGFQNLQAPGFHNFQAPGFQNVFNPQAQSNLAGPNFNFLNSRLTNPHSNLFNQNHLGGLSQIPSNMNHQNLFNQNNLGSSQILSNTDHQNEQGHDLGLLSGMSLGHDPDMKIDTKLFKVLNSDNFDGNLPNALKGLGMNSDSDISNSLLQNLQNENQYANLFGQSNGQSLFVTPSPINQGNGLEGIIDQDVFQFGNSRRRQSHEIPQYSSSPDQNSFPPPQIPPHIPPPHNPPHIPPPPQREPQTIINHIHITAPKDKSTEIDPIKRSTSPSETLFVREEMNGIHRNNDRHHNSRQNNLTNKRKREIKTDNPSGYTYMSPFQSTFGSNAHQNIFDENSTKSKERFGKLIRSLDDKAFDSFISAVKFDSIVDEWLRRKKNSIDYNTDFSEKMGISETEVSYNSEQIMNDLVDEYMSGVFKAYPRIARQMFLQPKSKQFSKRSGKGYVRGFLDNFPGSYAYSVVNYIAGFLNGIGDQFEGTTRERSYKINNRLTNNLYGRVKHDKFKRMNQPKLPYDKKLRNQLLKNKPYNYANNMFSDGSFGVRTRSPVNSKFDLPGQHQPSKINEQNFPQHKPIFHHATKPGTNVIKSSESISNNVLAGENIENSGSENIHEKTTLYEDNNMIINIRYPKPTDQEYNSGGDSEINTIIKDPVPVEYNGEEINLHGKTYEKIAEIPIWDKRPDDNKVHDVFEIVEYIEDLIDLEEYDNEDNLYSEPPMMYEPTHHNVIEKALKIYPIAETPTNDQLKENRIGLTHSEAGVVSPNPNSPPERFTLQNDPDQVVYERIHNPKVRFDIDPLSRHSGSFDPLSHSSFDPLSQHKTSGVRSADLISDELMRKHQRREVLNERINL